MVVPPQAVLLRHLTGRHLCGVEKGVGVGDFFPVRDSLSVLFPDPVLQRSLTANLQNRRKKSIRLIVEAFHF